MDEADLAVAARQAREAQERIVHSFRAMAQAFLPAVRALGEQLAIVGRAIEETTDKAYEEAGRPYGPGAAAKWRWLHELARAEALAAKAAEVEAWQREAVLVREAREASEAEG